VRAGKINHYIRETGEKDIALRMIKRNYHIIDMVDIRSVLD
tara:strand:+ start:595 stop:717 length:123 start_codon:yes stop_codon:yes gene_type:complete